MCECVCMYMCMCVWMDMDVRAWMHIPGLPCSLKVEMTVAQTRYLLFSTPKNQMSKERSKAICTPQHELQLIHFKFLSVFL